MLCESENKCNSQGQGSAGRSRGVSVDSERDRISLYQVEFPWSRALGKRPSVPCKHDGDSESDRLCFIIPLHR